MLTDKEHLSGTSSVSEVAMKLPQFEYYYNEQGG